MNWDYFRTRVLLSPEVNNLNCGSFGPSMVRGHEFAAEQRLQLASRPMDFYLRLAPSLLAKARTELSAWINHNPTRLFFTNNVSTAINQVGRSLVGSGFRGVILTTDLEYGCIRWFWEVLANQFGAEIRTIKIPRMPEDSGEILDSFAKEMTEGVKILFFSHVISATGMVLPIEEICSLARVKGITTIVDGAHGPGQMALDLEKIRASAYCANLHKWLCSPTGGAFIAFHDELAERLEPVTISWGYSGYCLQPERKNPISQDDPDLFGSTARLRRLEFQGTQDVCPWLSVPSVLEEWREIGSDAIYARQREMSGFTRDLMTNRGLEVWTPANGKLSGAMTAWELPSEWNLEAVRNWLYYKHRIEVGLNRLPSGELLLRVSNHFFTQKSEVEQLSNVFRKSVPDLMSEVGDYL